MMTEPLTFIQLNSDPQNSPIQREATVNQADVANRDTVDLSVTSL